ncbi:hypothetical protein GGD81_004223 [Rhodobium orientis]|uniref:hypothetical protein n=1 Tax=Rhodobium orientis TaxID=34017 RepID=UPI001473D3F9|nr:hypothetical protein [Rhodobium orientis]MBB4305155.1 hypothetical protein [Rhodobium orientis]
MAQERGGRCRRRLRQDFDKPRREHDIQRWQAIVPATAFDSGKARNAVRMRIDRP